MILVYPSTQRAKQANRTLIKSIAEEEDADGYVTAKPIPVDLWPPATRIEVELGPATTDESTLGMKGRLRLRKARTEDVKQSGSRNASYFYKKYGERAGKEMYDPPVASENRSKRRRGNDPSSDSSRRATLDAELDSLRDGPDLNFQTGRNAAIDQFLRDEQSVSRGRNTQENGRRPRKTQQELDDELDAFLQERD